MRAAYGSIARYPVLGLLAGLAFAVGCGFTLSGFSALNLSLGQTEPLSMLWQDLGHDMRVRAGGYVGVVHLLFFRLFVLETIGLNLYLFLGLVAALAMLAFRYALVDGAVLTSAFSVGRNSSNSRGMSGDRLRVVTRFRRQVRRTNSSRLRYVNVR